jgi:hypothetical protein
MGYCRGEQGPPKVPPDMSESSKVRRRWMGWAAIAVVIVAILCIGTVLALALLLSPAGNAARERVMGETPQAKITGYLKAIQRGDRSAALEAWEVGAPQQQHYAALSQRREKVTDELLAPGISGWRVLEIEWWTTCCEPHVTCSVRSAGGARIQVQVLDDDGNPLRYTFDVFAREQPYWGDAMGNPVRRWVIRDVYAAGEEPLFWRWVHESGVRYLQ